MFKTKSGKFLVDIKTILSIRILGNGYGLVTYKDKEIKSHTILGEDAKEIMQEISNT